MTNKRQMINTYTKRLLIFAALVYLAILVGLMTCETQLVYPGSKYPKGDWKPNQFQFEEIRFDSADGTGLVGWYLAAPEPKAVTELEDSGEILPAAKTVLLCHGNGENVAESSACVGDYFRRHLNAEVFVFDYRGFGKSEGVPHEAGVLADSEAALAWLQERSGKSSEEIILVGHSLGGGPAVHLAASFGCKALVLQRTFNSLTDAAQGQYPWLPVKYLVRNRYPSSEKITNYNGPLFQSHGSLDTLIPLDLAEQLFAAAPTSTKQMLVFQGMGHYDPLPAEYWQKMAGFIDKLP